MSGSRWYMTDGIRKRWFCCLCGKMTDDPVFDSGMYAYCRFHSDMARAERDLIPPDPLTTIPPMRVALTGEDVQAAREKGH